jgi:hypothetical protein
MKSVFFSIKVICYLLPLILTFGGGVWVGWHGHKAVQEQPTLRFLVKAIGLPDRPFQ